MPRLIVVRGRANFKNGASTANCPIDGTLGDVSGAADGGAERRAAENRGADQHSLSIQASAGTASSCGPAPPQPRKQRNFVDARVFGSPFRSCASSLLGSPLLAVKAADKPVLRANLTCADGAPSNQLRHTLATVTKRFGGTPVINARVLQLLLRRRCRREARQVRGDPGQVGDRERS